MSLNGFNFENTYSKLPKEFFQKNLPSKVSAPNLINWNKDLASFLGVQVDLSDPESINELTAVVSGNSILKGSVPLSAAYSGHQFGHFSPLLGDGRAHLLGELKGEDGKLYDVQLKGSGRSAFSRSGDGRSPLGPVIREYVVSEAMHCLGVPTTRSLAAVTTGESVFREEELAGGVLTRVSESLIRVGSFEYFASRQDVSGLRALLNYVIKRSFPELVDLSKNDGGDVVLLFFKEVMNRQIKLVSKWMSLGFIHGVMNTDNTSIAGVTIDYGPCAFLDEYDSKKVFSFIDKNGRYSYSNQPLVLNWNLVRLAEALVFLCPETEEDSAIAHFEHEIKGFQKTFNKELQSLMEEKLGLLSSDDFSKSNDAIIKQFLEYLETSEVDYTLGFRRLSVILRGGEIDQSVYKKNTDFNDFIKAWINLVKEQKKISEFRVVSSRMDQVNPIYIPRNHLIEDVISSAYKNDFSKMNEIVEVLKTPFKEMSDLNKSIYYNPSIGIEKKVINTFCGT